jgi:putative radical SAM enzyme (TIGR03279 family)
MEVRSGSLADEIGLKAGDRLVSINGWDIDDDLDFRFRAAEGIVDLVINRRGQAALRKTVLLANCQQLGLTVEDFRPKACNNKCVFCFVDQLPKGTRRTLRFKDDDFRLSFLHGNYLTLTNLTERDIERIIEQRLSPLYVSVHATELPVRAKMLGRSEEHASLKPLLQLLAGGIAVHAQIVLCPAINDGAHLEHTLVELSKQYPGIVSVAIVPLGTSQYRANLTSLNEVTPEYCRQVIRQIKPFQRNFRKRLGVTFVYLADEFYLQSGESLPCARYYDDFQLLEDGVGLVRYFDQEFKRAMKRRWKVPSGRLDGTLVTGKLFYPFLCEYSRQLECRFGGNLRVVGIENKFLGPKITVAGLLSGADIIAALRGRDLGQWVLLPGEALSAGSSLFLDDMSLDTLQSELKVPIKATQRTVESFFQFLQE